MPPFIFALIVRVDLAVFEYIGAALHGMACCAKGNAPPLRPPPPLMGGRPPCPPRPKKIVNGVRAVRPPVFTKFARRHSHVLHVCLLPFLLY
jgi:hypothetical protein